MAKPKVLYFTGPRDAQGRPLEFFGGMPGEYDPIPARDLTEADTAQLTEAQWACIDSPTGKRLYSATKPEPTPSASTGDKAASSNTEAPPSDTSASTTTS